MNARAYVVMWDVPCPKCQAEPGKPCQRGTVGPMPSGKFHTARQRAALTANHEIKRKNLLERLEAR